MKKIISIALVAAMLLCAFCATACKKNKQSEPFDYANAPLDEYISLSSEDYKNLSVEVETIKEIDESSVSVAIDSMLVQFAQSVTLTEAGIKAGDNISFYYVAICDGRIIGQNVTNASPAKAVVGEGLVIPGLDEELVGVIPNSTSLAKITAGQVKQSYTVYLDYTAKYEGKTETAQEKFSLSDCVYGDEFATKLIGQTVGTPFSFTHELDIDGDGNSENVSFDAVVLVATIETPVSFELRFPDPYPENESLSDRELTLELFIESTQRIELPPLTDTLLREKLGFLGSASLKGDTLVEQFKEYMRQGLVETRASNIESSAKNAIWTTLAALAQVKAYPEQAVAQSRAEYLQELQYYFAVYSQQYASSFPYSTYQEYGYDYLGLDSKLEFDEALDKFVREKVLRKMLMYYIANAEGLTLSNEEKTTAINSFTKYYSANSESMFGQKFSEAQILSMYGADFICEQYLENKVVDYLYQSTIVEEIITQK